jgi:hypothetical protein
MALVSTQADPLTITEVTLGEVYRLMLAQGLTLQGISASLEKRPTWDDINRLEASREAQELLQNQAIKALEDGSRWLVRTVGTALVTALGTAVVVALRVAGSG